MSHSLISYVQRRVINKYSILQQLGDLQKLILKNGLSLQLGQEILNITAQTFLIDYFSKLGLLYPSTHLAHLQWWIPLLKNELEYKIVLGAYTSDENYVLTFVLVGSRPKQPQATWKSLDYRQRPQQFPSWDPWV